MILDLPRTHPEGYEDSDFLSIEHTIKIVDVFWTPSQDNFAFKVPHSKTVAFQSEVTTKRIHLSDISEANEPPSWFSSEAVHYKYCCKKGSWCWRDQKHRPEVADLYITCLSMIN